MKVRVAGRWSVDESAFGPAPTRAIKDAKSEEQRVLKRLQGLIESHQESAVRMRVALGAEDILAVVDALEAEAGAEQADPLRPLKCQDEIREYARLALYDELLGEPSNVFFATPVNDETTRYEAMPRAFWLDCLRALRREWESKPRTILTEDTTNPPEPEAQA
ncbi:MAG: hypothetical protein AAGD06_28350 [Acidobacteriota bacterium]